MAMMIKFNERQERKEETIKNLKNERSKFNDDEKWIKWLEGQLIEDDERMFELQEKLAKHERFHSVINRASSNFHMCSFEDVNFN